MEEGGDGFGSYPGESYQDGAYQAEEKAGNGYQGTQTFKG